ncbi:MAG: YcjX family protein, partial [Devosiaceae bacterium]|nr:YcjX family protein [Devosiaceae bacterium MH13]
MPTLPLLDEAKLTASDLAHAATDLWSPTLRIGVTGLSRAGKTVFLTALVHALLYGRHLPAFQAQRSGRLIGAQLAPQPDDEVARFAIEQHIDALLNERRWPTSTRQISQLRLTLRFEPQSALARALGRSFLHLDMVDYPGEWLLDLPLLDQSFAQFSAQALEKARGPDRESLASGYLQQLAETKAAETLDEPAAQGLAQAYTDYLRACREHERALSMLPPGRFLMPGDLEGSPALTF